MWIPFGSCIIFCPDLQEECKLFAPCWWTPSRIGLIAGFSSIFTVVCLCCTGWKCICKPSKEQPVDESEDSDEDEDECKDDKKRPHPRPHDIVKQQIWTNSLLNHNVITLSPTVHASACWLSTLLVYLYDIEFLFQTTDTTA